MLLSVAALSPFRTLSRLLILPIAFILSQGYQSGLLGELVETKKRVSLIGPEPPWKTISHKEGKNKGGLARRLYSHSLWYIAAWDASLGRVMTCYAAIQWYTGWLSSKPIVYRQSEKQDSVRKVESLGFDPSSVRETRDQAKRGESSAEPLAIYYSRNASFYCGGRFSRGSDRFGNHLPLHWLFWISPLDPWGGRRVMTLSIPLDLSPVRAARKSMG